MQGSADRFPQNGLVIRRSLCTFLSTLALGELRTGACAALQETQRTVLTARKQKGQERG